MKLATFLIALAVGAGAFAEDEQLHQQVVLVAPTNAPFSVAGTAVLRAETKNGISSSRIAVEVKGFAAGTYRVSVTRKSDRHVVELGTFAVTGSADPDGNEEVAIRFGTNEGLPLPDGLAPMDIGSLSVADAGQQTLLTGSFTEADETTRALFKAKVVAAGKAGATGSAQIRTRTRQGFKTERFKLNVSGVTPNATLSLKINGEDFGTVTTDEHGKLRLKSLPEGVEPESIELIEFAEPDGTNALTISF
jgi:hypothetical protein